MPEGQLVTLSLRTSCACRELGTTAASATPPGMPSLYPVGQLSAQQMEGVALCASILWWSWGRPTWSPGCCPGSGNLTHPCALMCERVCVCVHTPRTVVCMLRRVVVSLVVCMLLFLYI